MNLIERWFVYWHGRGAPHQDLLYRCTTCHGIITWKKIHSGKTCCGGRLATTDVQLKEKFMLLFLPWMA